MQLYNQRGWRGRVGYVANVVRASPRTAYAIGTAGVAAGAKRLWNATEPIMQRKRKKLVSKATKQNSDAGTQNQGYKRSVRGKKKPRMTANKIMSLLFPRRKIRWENNATLNSLINTVGYLQLKYYLGAPDNLIYYQNFMKDLNTNVTLLGSEQIYLNRMWSSHVIKNPSNEVVHINIMEFFPKKGASYQNSPILLTDQDLTDTTIDSGAFANMNVEALNWTTPVDGAGGYIAENGVYRASNNSPQNNILLMSPGMKRQYKIKQTKRILQPGDTFTYRQEQRNFKVFGNDTKGSSGGYYGAPFYQRNIVIRFHGPLSVDNDVVKALNFTQSRIVLGSFHGAEGSRGYTLNESNGFGTANLANIGVASVYTDEAKVNVADEP